MSMPCVRKCWSPARSSAPCRPSSRWTVAPTRSAPPGSARGPTREKAEAVYKEALYAGKTAGLLEENRADTFQQRLGNLEPDRVAAGDIPTHFTLDLRIADAVHVHLAEGAPLDRDLVLRWPAATPDVGVTVTEGPGLPAPRAVTRS